MTNKKTHNSSDIEARLITLAHDLNSVVTREHQILQDELGQISRLVQDAVTALSHNFDNFARLSSRQTDLMSDIMNNGAAADSKNIQTMAFDLNEKVGVNTKAVMRALQFDDIVQQLTAHSRNRAEQMESLFSCLASRVKDVECMDSREIEQISKLIEAMRADVARYRNALEKANPVKQTSVNEGDIELF